MATSGLLATSAKALPTTFCPLARLNESTIPSAGRTSRIVMPCAPSCRSMPNVLQLLDSFNQGGTEWQTVQLTRLLHESGKYRIFLASLNSEGPLRAEVERLGYRDIPSFPLQNFYNANALKQLKRLASFMRKNK